MVLLIPLLVFMVCGTNNARSISDLNFDVQYPDRLYIDEMQKITIIVENIGDEIAKELEFRIEVPQNAITIQRPEALPSVIKPDETITVTFDISGAKTGEFTLREFEWIDEHGLLGRNLIQYHLQ